MKLLPSLLTEDQKQNQVQVTTNLKFRCGADPNFI